MKTITLRVCQGVGDIFWVYQKFAPHFDRINFEIIHLKNAICKKQSRAVDFLKLLPKVDHIGANFRTPEEYDRIAHHRFSMQQILEVHRPERPKAFDYACNGPLEEGIRIEDIDPGIELEETVPLKIEPASLPHPSKGYLVVYVSGSVTSTYTARKLKLWTPAAWVRFIERFMAKYRLKLPVVLIGADYDRHMAVQIAKSLHTKKYRATVLIDQPPARILDLLRQSKCFLGYQSGLNILADNLDVPQVMLYFPYLKPMLNTWCKQRNLTDGLFNAATFDMTPDAVLDGLKFSF